MTEKQEISKEIAIKAEVLTPKIADDSDFESFAGAGMEHVTASDVIVPRLSIIQGLSPQMSKSKAEYIPGASIGDIVDVSIGDLFKDGIVFIPCMFKTQYLEWAPRVSGKGLQGVHDDPSIMDNCTRDEKGGNYLPNGNLVSQTAQWLGLNVTADFRRSFIGMSSTNLKKSRKWMTLATGTKIQRADGSFYTPPLFQMAYSLSTAEESNAQGSWSSWSINRLKPINELELGIPWKEVLKECVSFYKMLASGEAKADLNAMREEMAGNGDYVDGEGAM